MTRSPTKITLYQAQGILFNKLVLSQSSQKPGPGIDYSAGDNPTHRTTAS